MGHTCARCEPWRAQPHRGSPVRMRDATARSRAQVQVGETWRAPCASAGSGKPVEGARQRWEQLWQEAGTQRWARCAHASCSQSTPHSTYRGVLEDCNGARRAGGGWLARLPRPETGPPMIYLPCNTGERRSTPSGARYGVVTLSVPYSTRQLLVCDVSRLCIYRLSAWSPDTSGVITSSSMRIPDDLSQIRVANHLAVAPSVRGDRRAPQAWLEMQVGKGAESGHLGSVSSHCSTLLRLTSCTSCGVGRIIIECFIAQHYSDSLCTSCGGRIWASGHLGSVSLLNITQTHFDLCTSCGGRIWASGECFIAQHYPDSLCTSCEGRIWASGVCFIAQHYSDSLCTSCPRGSQRPLWRSTPAAPLATARFLCPPCRATRSRIDSTGAAEHPPCKPS